jgi:tungstate transport system permease protein
MDLIGRGIREALELLIQRDPLVLDAALRSIWISVSAVALAGLLGTALGLLLARLAVPGRWLIVLLCRTGMGLPTVLIGLLGYALLSRRGPLGGLDLLFTPWAIVGGEFLLAFPLVVTLTHGALARQDPRIAETALTLGAGPLRRGLTYLSEVRLAVALALLTAFSRCFSELGIAMMVGGNLKFRTRTLATATALETAQGEFSRGVAMSLILLFIGLLVTLLVGVLERANRSD